MSIRKSEILALALLGWAGLSLFWSPDPYQGSFQIAHGLLAIVLFLVIVRLPDGAISNGILPGVALALCVHFWLLYDLPKDWFGGFGNKNFGAEYLMGAIPLAAVAFWNNRARYLGFAIALAAAVCLFTVYSQANAKYAALIALGMGVAGFLISRRLYLIAGIVVLGPVDVAVLYGINVWSISSLRTRLEIWTNTVALWLEKPWFGHGFGSFNHEYPRLQEQHLSLFPEMGTLLNQPAMYSGAAHNDPLQILAELGLVGLVLAAAFVIVLLKGRFAAGKITALDYGALASLAMTGGAAIVGFPLQNPSTILLAVIALAMLARGEKEIASGKAPRLIVAGVVLPVSVFLMAVGWQHYASRVEFTKVRANLEANNLGSALIAGVNSVRLFEWDWLPRFQLGMTLAAVAIHDPKSVVEPMAADRIFDIARTASPWSPIISYTRIAYLDSTGRADERRNEIEGLLDLLHSNATLQPPTWAAELWFSSRYGYVERARFAEAVLADPKVLNHLGHEYPEIFKEFVNGKRRQ